MRKEKILKLMVVLTIGIVLVAMTSNVFAADSNSTVDFFEDTTNQLNTTNTNTNTYTSTNTNTNNTNANGADTDGGAVVDDVVDGVGDAGKDIIDGVENGVDDATGNNNNGNTTDNSAR